MNKSIQMLNISPDELKTEIVKDVTTSLLQALSKEFTPKQPTVYLTRQEVADMLKVDLSTIWNYTKQSKLISYGISGRVYYKRSEIEAAIIQLNK